MWRSENNLWDLILSLYHVGPKKRTQVAKLGHNPLTPEPSHIIFATFIVSFVVFAYVCRYKHVHSGAHNVEVKGQFAPPTVDSEARTQVIRLGGKPLYLLSRPAAPRSFTFRAILCCLWKITKACWALFSG